MRSSTPRFSFDEWCRLFTALGDEWRNLPRPWLEHAFDMFRREEARSDFYRRPMPDGWYEFVVELADLTDPPAARTAADTGPEPLSLLGDPVCRQLVGRALRSSEDAQVLAEWASTRRTIEHDPSRVAALEKLERWASVVCRRHDVGQTVGLGDLERLLVRSTTISSPEPVRAPEVVVTAATPRERIRSRPRRTNAPPAPARALALSPAA